MDIINQVMVGVGVVDEINQVMVGVGGRGRNQPGNGRGGGLWIISTR